jgi:methylglutaconyl-CoA hydratase
MSSFSHISVEISDKIAVVTLTRPERHNALNYVSIQELREAFDHLDSHPQVRIVILKGTEGTFCAGTDFEYLQKLQEYDVDANLYDTNHTLELFVKMYRLRKLLITQVDGYALAQGCAMVSVSDICISSSTAQFGFPEVKYGSIPSVEIPFIVRRVGQGPARYLLVSGDKIDAAAALRMGLVTRVVEPEHLDDEVIALAVRLSRENSSGAIDITKRLIADVQDLPLMEGLYFTAKMNAHARLSQESKFGASCFLGKEPFQW